MLFPSSVLMQIFIKLVKNKGNSGYYRVIKDLVLARTSLQSSNCKCVACVNHSLIL